MPELDRLYNERESALQRHDAAQRSCSQVQQQRVGAKQSSAPQ